MSEKGKGEMEEMRDVLAPGSNTVTRRRLLKIIGIGGLGTFGITVLGTGTWKGVQASTVAQATPATITEAQVLVANAQGMVIANPTRCVGCRRCELACTEFNDGKAQPAIARVKVNRNYNFGPRGAQLGFWRGEGAFGNHLLIQDTCRQCPHPVPCQMACAYGAIEVVPPVNARVVNVEKCVGCRMCQEACPWEMMSFDEALKKATKCHLCGGDPECVKACPAGALEYVPWQDMTKVIPRRLVVPAYITTPANVQATCAKCH